MVTGSDIDWPSFPWWNRLQQGWKWYASHPAAVPTPEIRPHLYSSNAWRFFHLAGYLLCCITLFSLCLSAVFSLNGDKSSMGWVLMCSGVVIVVGLHVLSWTHRALGFNAIHALWLAVVSGWAVSTSIEGWVVVLVVSLVMIIFGALCGYLGERVEMITSGPEISVPMTHAAGIDPVEGKFEHGSAEESGGFGILLRALSKMPGATVFHGLSFPGNKNDVVDHVAIRGRTAVFILSGDWKRGRYAWGDDGRITRNDHTVVDSRANMFAQALSGYSSSLPDITVYGVVVVDGRGVMVDSKGNAGTGIPLADAQGAMGIIGSLLESDGRSTEMALVRFMTDSMSPR